MIICPKCNNQDAIQKVTSIVSGQTFQTSYSVPVQGELGGHKFYGTVEKTGVGTTELARKLSKPTDKDWRDLENINKDICQRYILREYLMHHPAPGRERKYHNLVFLIGVICFFSFVMLASGGSDFGLACLIGLGFPLSWPLAWIVYQLSNFREYKQWVSERRKYVNQMVSMIRKEVDFNYNLLYYCHRDDVVFLPGTNYCVSADEMKTMGAWVELGKITLSSRPTRAST